ncbi:MAG: sulfotransferase [Coleofasciculus sp. G1-WW12-02]|uniref:sulfotransferase n=1 Tax=Coleofasciculus sp. G1-WW12-02 TaxID=3068483 RepID=UPI0032F4C4D9
MQTKHLDFIIIGAMKAGTTSLFKYLQPHPEIYMIPEKETSFFSSDYYFKKRWENFANEVFQGAPLDKMWGKASPSYMPDPRVPQRIYEIMPNVKLIALLRNPIDRAFSHYKHLLRQKRERRSFEEIVSEQLTEKSLDYTRALPGLLAVNSSYISMGEYGRILQSYLMESIYVLIQPGMKCQIYFLFQRQII